MKQTKKMFIKAIVVFLIVALIIPTTAITTFASAVNSENITIKSSATIENDFADNRVIVILSQKASLRFIDYKPEDFSEVDCKNVFAGQLWVCVESHQYSL